MTFFVVGGLILLFLSLTWAQFLAWREMKEERDAALAELDRRSRD